MTERENKKGGALEEDLWHEPPINLPGGLGVSPCPELGTDEECFAA